MAPKSDQKWSNSRKPAQNSKRSSPRSSFFRVLEWGDPLCSPRPPQIEAKMSKNEHFWSKLAKVVKTRENRRKGQKALSEILLYLCYEAGDPLCSPRPPQIEAKMSKNGRFLSKLATFGRTAPAPSPKTRGNGTRARPKNKIF